jgi:tetratricopeptide (TPR) repeat protein
MNAQPQSVAATGPGANTVDERNPWLGLASFTEETRAYFYGRDEEVAELSRRVQRKLLTVLFGQSGLGKTSILRAGLAPRLRGQGYCPIYVRIDYGKDTPEPAEQIKQAISRTARHSGEWTRAGVAVEGESLWEFLHHRDDVLCDESGATLIPLLIFDQFEEIFTLAQSDDFGRARAARFIEELADLVENRPPKSLEAKLEEDESGAERFDFARGDYRVLIALREDYLAPLEGLKKAMPSISQNRLRLAPMTGEQALAAVVQPGKRLVTDEVAAAIVRFVAGGAEIAHAEVEPSLLSLICRELNDTRVAQGRDEISLDLLAGSHASILSNFYERSLADQAPAVRQVIEDELLTTSGFRENIAEERLLSRFKAVGAAPDTLAILVNRRLLRIEERLDVRRVEITHDVLCGVVKSSRDLRREREAREATERLLAEQHSRELSARRALLRARQIAVGCTVLAVGALIAAVLAYLSTQRARRAEVEAQETRATAEQARGHAEHLVGYLADDFVRELESFGRLNVLAEFSQRQIDYFHALPPALKGSETTRNGALAMVHHARAMRTLGNLDIGIANATEAEQLLERQRAAGDHSEATTIALALAYSINAAILDNENDPAGPTAGKRASELLRPLAEAPDASVAARRAYVQVLSRIGYEQQAANQLEGAVLTEQKSIRFATALGARDLTDLNMGAYYAESAAWMVTALASLGRNDEARKSGDDALAVADKVLEQRPGFRLALHAEQVIEGSLAGVAQNELNPAEAIRINRRNTQTSLTLLKLDPNNVTSSNNLGVADQTQGDFLWALGEVREAIPYYLKSLDEYGRAAAGGAGFVVIHSYDTAITAFRQAQIGDAAGSAATVAKGAPFLTRLRQSEPKGSMAVVIVEAMEKIPAAGGAFERGDLATALRIATDAVSQLQSAKPEGALQASQRSVSLFVASHIAGRTEFRLGNFAAAERAERAALAARKEWGNQATPDQRDLGEVSTWLAMSLARQDRIAEAAQTIGPVVTFQRELAARNHGDKWQPFELACALYVQSLTDNHKSAALLREAAGLVDGLPPTLRALHDVRLWRDLVQEAQKSAAGLGVPASAERSAE